MCGFVGLYSTLANACPHQTESCRDAEMSSIGLIVVSLRVLIFLHLPTFLLPGKLYAKLVYHLHEIRRVHQTSFVFSLAKALQRIPDKLSSQKDDEMNSILCTSSANIKAKMQEILLYMCGVCEKVPMCVCVCV
eukprot:c33741_g1_i1 orf=82-483(+)